MIQKRPSIESLSLFIQNFILQDAVVCLFDKFQLAFEFAFPLGDVGKQSPAQVCTQNRAYGERKCPVSVFCKVCKFALYLLINDEGGSDLACSVA